MTADLFSHSRCGRTLACYPLVTLEACATALTACGVTFCAPARLAQAGMCWSGGIGQWSSRRLRWRLASRCTWLRTPLFRCATSCSSPRALTTRSRRTLCCLCVSRRVRCLSSVLACVHGLHMPRHPVCGSGSRVSCLLAGSAPALVHGGSSTSAQGVQRIHSSSPTSRRRAAVHRCVTGRLRFGRSGPDPAPAWARERAAGRRTGLQSAVRPRDGALTMCLASRPLAVRGPPTPTSVLRSMDNAAWSERFGSRFGCGLVPLGPVRRSCVALQSEEHISLGKKKNHQPRLGAYSPRWEHRGYYTPPVTGRARSHISMSYKQPKPQARRSHDGATGRTAVRSRSRRPRSAGTQTESAQKRAPLRGRTSARDHPPQRHLARASGPPWSMCKAAHSPLSSSASS